MLAHLKIGPSNATVVFTKTTTEPNEPCKTCVLSETSESSNVSETTGPTSDRSNDDYIYDNQYQWDKWQYQWSHKYCTNDSERIWPRVISSVSSFFTSRFPSTLEMSLGTSLGSQEISQASNEFPKISRVLVEYEQLGNHQSINQFTINPSLGSALGNPSM